MHIQTVDDDAAWLARVREEAGKWWLRTDRERTLKNGPLDTVVPLSDTEPIGIVTSTHPWQVQHRASGQPVGGNWQFCLDARLWLWLALGICQWHLVPDVATARREWGEELDRMEAQLRAAVGARAAGVAAEGERG